MAGLTPGSFTAKSLLLLRNVHMKVHAYAKLGKSRLSVQHLSVVENVKTSQLTVKKIKTSNDHSPPVVFA